MSGTMKGALYTCVGTTLFSKATQQCGTEVNVENQQISDGLKYLFYKVLKIYLNFIIFLFPMSCENLCIESDISEKRTAM